MCLSEKEWKEEHCYNIVVQCPSQLLYLARGAEDRGTRVTQTGERGRGEEKGKEDIITLLQHCSRRDNIVTALFELTTML